MGMNGEKIVSQNSSGANPTTFESTATMPALQ
jgi:hypothetical protein